jgi:hypothetical protein
MHIVHESIHAMQDIAGGTQYSPRGSIYTSETENEAAAYVGGALFSLYDTGAVYGGHPHATAFRIAQSIQNVKGARVSDTDATILRTAVWMHPVYFFDGVSMWSPTFADGLGS